MSAIREQLKNLLATHPDAIVYLNMSNGLDAYETAKDIGVPEDRIRFSYVQSTQLESRSHDVLLCSLGADMLMELALGRACVIVDFGGGKDISRAVYQGVPFIRYCLERAWFGDATEDAVIYPRRFDGHPMPVSDDFDKRYHALNRRTKSFLAKFARYANLPGSIERHNKVPKLFGCSEEALHDGDYLHFANKAEEIGGRIVPNPDNNHLAGDSEDYSGYADFMGFKDISVNLPDDLIATIEELAAENPRFGFNGICAILLRKGLDDFSGDPL